MAKSPKLPPLSPEQQSVFDELRKNVNSEVASALAELGAKDDIAEGMVENAFNQAKSEVLTWYEKFTVAAKKDIEKHLLAVAQDIL